MNAGAIAIPEISESEFRKLSALIYERCGIKLGPEKKALLQSRLSKVLRKEGIPSYEDYYRRVISDRSGRELIRLIDLITTNFTHFFREHQHFQYLREHILPEMRELGAKGIYIWSAGCATGEEPYSIAITLLESPGVMDWRKEILASDVSTQALEFAREGVYPEERLKGGPPEWRRKYFLKEGDRYRLKDRVRRMVEFRRLNLLSPPPWRGCFDVIFCRNVMIYFDQPTKRRVLGSLLQALKPGGYLFVGHAESLLRLGDGFRYVKPSIYRRET